MIEFKATTTLEKEIEKFINEYGQAFYNKAKENGDTHEQANKFAIWALKEIVK